MAISCYAAMKDVDIVRVSHPDMKNRYFVLKPLCEICPDFVHPI